MESKPRMLEFSTVTLAPVDAMLLPWPQYPPLPLCSFWFLTATRFSVPDEPGSYPIPTVAVIALQPRTELVPSTPTSVRLTLAACTSTCTADGQPTPNWHPFETQLAAGGIVMTAAPALALRLVTPLSVSGVPMVICSG